MKKILLVVLLVSALQIFALDLLRPNNAVDVLYQGKYVVLQNNENTVYGGQAGAPAIPLVSYFIELEPGSIIKDIVVTPQKLEELSLSAPVQPIQQAAAFSQAKPDFTAADAAYYHSEAYPQSWLHSQNVYNCGQHTILAVSLFAALYEPQKNILHIPENFRLNIETGRGELPQYNDSQVTNDVLCALGLAEETSREPGGYLAISPLMFYNSLTPLLDWRRQQGYDVHYLSTGDISTNYAGEDMPAKIRAAISDMQQTWGIEYVTLAGDNLHIPSRYAFAFDCAYGAHAGENDLACDMYYSCLDGDWNADADTLYGEDEDDADLLPEVYVGRIPVNSAQQMSSYINKLMQYEKGLIDDYNRAGGISMELWDGSQSELCQQYIYDNYFPDNYDIEFIWGDENTEENAFALLSSGRNIVQHTGHAWINVLSLENYGHIYNSNIADLTNDWGGMIYSIGCWSNAIDYDSIGETFIHEEQRNFLGYVGNSSYGWGAPSAAGFGFSEFYEKEFFRVLFSGESNVQHLGKVQALHKLAFIPYFSGTSIYKWVGYELNLCGDAAAALFIDNPQNLNVSASHDEEHVYVCVNNEQGIPVAGAVISMGEQIWQTAADGSAILPWTAGNENSYNIYAAGYIDYALTIHEITQEPVLQITAEQSAIEQATEYPLHLTVINPLADEISFTLSASSQPAVIEFGYDPQQIYTVSANSSLELDDLIIELLDTAQLENDEEINIMVELQMINMTFPITAGITMYVRNASLELTAIEWFEEDFQPGNQTYINFTFTNNVALDDINSLQLELAADIAQYLNYSPQQIVLYPSTLEEEEEIVFSAVLEISENMPQEYFAELAAEINVTWDTNKSWQDNFCYYLGDNNLQINEDFEDELNWTGAAEWQRVTTYSASETHSLSCRPSSVGNYLLSTPVLTWAPGTNLSFWYRSKMPMYGEDGFYLRLITDNIEELIIFLGSGGALAADTQRPLPEIYLENNWVYYEFELQEILDNTPLAGETYQLVFDFNCSEIIAGFSEYDIMDEIGVFIDDLQIGQSAYNTDENPDEIISSSVLLYPNPLTSADSRSVLHISFSLSLPGMVESAVYDIRGRKQDNVYAGILQAGQHNITWYPAEKMANGIYFLRLKTPQKDKMSKFIILR